MAFIPVANTARVCLKYTLFDQQVCNIMWFEGSDPWDAAALLDLCTQLNSWVVGELQPIRSNSLIFTGSEARDMTTESAPSVEAPLATPVAGTLTGGGTPGNVALAIKFATGLTGRSFRGRNYMAGLDPDQITGNEISTGLRDAYLAAFDELGTYLVSTAAEHVVVSLFSGTDLNGAPIPRAAGVTTPVISYVVDRFVDSMRRRLTGRGI